MRITNSILLRGYNRDLNRLMTQKTACERRITSTRKFSRASEAPLAAAKALNVRKSLYYTEQYTENLKTANKFYTEAETSLLQVSDKLATISETIIAACNTTKDEEEYTIYGEQLEMIAKELVSIFNTDSAGRAIFGGESDDSMPFSLLEDSSGRVSTVLYHGVPVNAMNDPNAFPYSDPVTIDIGLGMDMDQKTQDVNPQSVLDISFNGAKVTGCGSEKGTADINLNSIKTGRKYCFDVYAGNIKKTIEFTGKATQQENIAEIQRALDTAYSKEVAYDKVKQPTIDKNGVIYSEGYIVCAVNNENSKATEKLGIDNDAGYTDKFKINFAGLASGKEYSVDVTVGDVTKSIKFVMDDSPVPEVRNKETIMQIQKALDDAFGRDQDGNHIVYISDNPVTQGTFSAEGKTVTVQDSQKISSGGTLRGAGVISEGYDTIDLLKLNAGNKYTIKVGGIPIEFTAQNTTAATVQALQNAMPIAGYKVSVPAGDKKTVYVTDAWGNYVKLGEIEQTDVGILPIKPSSGAKYTVDVNNLNEGQEYCLKVIYNNKAKEINFIGSADPATAASSVRAALAETFGFTGVHAKLQIDDNGVVTAYDGNPVSVVTMEDGDSKDAATSSRDTIYSDNYIQLTIDAARALRAGDIDYANGCIDRIAMATEKLLVQIADLGCNEDFIDFNIEKLTTRELNLSERQNDLEVTEAEKEITLWKTYEALYNACLQMSSSVVPNSIFNYIR